MFNYQVTDIKSLEIWCKSPVYHNILKDKWFWELILMTTISLVLTFLIPILILPTILGINHILNYIKPIQKKNKEYKEFRENESEYIFKEGSDKTLYKWYFQKDK